VCSTCLITCIVTYQRYEQGEESPEPSESLPPVSTTGIVHMSSKFCSQIIYCMYFDTCFIVRMCPQYSPIYMYTTQ